MRQMMQYLIVSSMALASCCAAWGGDNTNQTQPAERSPILLDSLNKSYLLYLKGQCQNEGIKDGTPEMTACMQRIAESNQDEGMRRRKAAREAPKTTQPVNPKLDNRSKNFMGNLRAEIAKCDSLSDQPAFSGKVIGTLLTADPNSPNKLDLLASRAKLTEAQGADLKAFSSQSYSCLKNIQSGITDLTLAGIIGNYMTRMDLAYANLYGRHSTIGEANAARLEAMESRDTQLARYPASKDCR